LALIAASLLVAVAIKADTLDARVSGIVTDDSGTGRTGQVTGSDSRGPVSLCITGRWELKGMWTLAVVQGVGTASALGRTDHSASLSGLGSGGGSLEAAVAYVGPGSPASELEYFGSGTLSAPTSTSASAYVRADVTITVFRCAAELMALTSAECNPASGCGGGSPPQCIPSASARVRTSLRPQPLG